MQSVSSSTGYFYSGIAAFRDAQPTVQVSGSATSPTTATNIVTCTPGTAGLWEVSGYIMITGTTVGATDTNNMSVNQTSTARYTPMIYIPSTTGSTTQWPITAVILNLSAADTVNIKPVVNATASSVYSAAIVVRRVG